MEVKILLLFSSPISLSSFCHSFTLHTFHLTVILTCALQLTHTLSLPYIFTLFHLLAANQFTARDTALLLLFLPFVFLPPFFEFLSRDSFIHSLHHHLFWFCRSSPFRPRLKHLNTLSLSKLFSIIFDNRRSVTLCVHF